MRVKPWEAGISCIGLAVALIFVFSNVWGLGVALVSADALWLLTRVEIRERHTQPGRYATLRGRLGVTRLGFILVIYAAVFYALLIVRSDLSSNARVAVIANFALAGLAFMLLGELKRSGDDAFNWLNGARAERRIGAELRQLADAGWLVLHGYKKDWGGDIDHVLCGPTGAYIVETKSYGLPQPRYSADGR